MSAANEPSNFKLTAEEDTLARFRDEFVLPTNKTMKATDVPDSLLDAPCTYLCGNSLGAMAKRSRKLLEEELDVWATRAVEGHFDHPHNRPWMYIADTIHPHFAEIVGAKESEVVCMGTLTANLHLMMNTFYKPTQERYKILCEAKAFPSDQYAFASQVAQHGFKASDAIIEMQPRKGEFTLREEDILDVIKQQGKDIALVLFAGVQYYSGQWFPMESVTKAGKDAGCVVGWDLAHAAGNVPMSLHDWGVDFAVWCTYKYLNSGPGNIGGMFVHERWSGKPTQYPGWWGHDPETRFAMPPHFSAIPGAQGFQQSNPSVFATVPLLGSLELIREAGGMNVLRQRSLRLTGYLEYLLHRSKYWITPERAGKLEESVDDEASLFGFTIITPSDPAARGSQLSLVFIPMQGKTMPKVIARLGARGVIGDSRKPDVIRLAPCALYNTFEDCERAAAVLEDVLEEVKMN